MCSSNDTQLRSLRANTLWVLVVLLCTRPLLASSVVVILTPKEHTVYVAADSLVIHKGKHLACKIKTFPADNCSFGLTGWADVKVDDAPRLSFKDTAANACKSTGTLREKADSFIATIKPRALELIDELRNFHPAEFAEMANGGDFLDVSFVGIDNGRLAVFVRGFHVKPDGQSSTIRDEAIDGVSSAARTFTIGANKAISAYMRSHEGWATGDMTVAIRKLVRIEEHDRPDIVGGPISILTVDWLGRTKWIKPGLCSDVTPKGHTEPKTHKHR